MLRSLKFLVYSLTKMPEQGGINQIMIIALAAMTVAAIALVVVLSTVRTLT